MLEQKLILATVRPVLDGTADEQLISFLTLARDELSNIITDYEIELKRNARLELENHTIEAVAFVDEVS